MNNNQKIILGLLFICLCSALPARGKREAPPVQEEKNIFVQGEESKEQTKENTENIDKDKNEVVLVSGIVRLVGNSPFTQLVITGTEMEWHVPREEEDTLSDLQHQMVIVEAEETVTVLRFANGVVAGERRTLKDIKVISIQ